MRATDRRGLRTTLLVVAWMACAMPSRANDVDPLTADDHARAALREGNYGFCRTPSLPLSLRAKKLCPYAADIPDCAGLVAACAPEKPKEKSPSSWTDTLVEILGPLAKASVWLLVIAIVLAIAYPLFKALARARRDKALADPIPEAVPIAANVPEPAHDVSSTLTAERLLAQAEDCARRGDHDRALFAYLQASLRALDERGAIRIERHRTHGEYVRGCKEHTAKEPLREIVREVDRVRFGGSRTTPDAVARVGSRAVALVRTASLVTLALSFIACGQAIAESQNNDPGEDGLMLDILHRQGAVVARLGGSLATMPIPGPKDTPPIVIVDTERTALEDDTRTHLVRWMEAGGTLVLAGAPESWPKSLEVHDAASSSLDVVITADANIHGFATETTDAVPEEDESYEGGFETDEPQKNASGSADPEKAAPETAVHVDRAKLAHSAALTFGKEATTLATLSSGQTYAAMRKVGRGWMLGVANDDLFTNAGLSRPGNASALMSLLSYAQAAADGDATTDAPPPFRVARPEDGITPPGNPLASIFRAGLGLGLVHALIATALLFAAAGIRHARARPTPNPARRAFAEHVEATGALYARTRLGAHALATYAKYADERLRAKMPRAMADPASFLAARSGVDVATCARIWARATEADPYGAGAQGDEIAVLKQLSNLVAAATRTD